MPVNTDSKAISNLLTIGVSDVIVKDELIKKLKSGKRLTIKLGIDPTGFDLHLGHMVVVHKLKEFQDLGHKIILIFGNFTGQIGDPTGKDEARPMRTQAELEKNAVHYLKQVSHVLDVDNIETRWNADWLSQLNFSDVIALASQFTVAQMLERDMYQERIKANKPISMHEFMYPLMQGYDSVALEADVELGGTDQTFNLHAGRSIQRAYGQEPQSILTVPILIGTDGIMKMGKSTNNYIGVADAPEDMYGKIMSIPDALILDYFELGARYCENDLEEVRKSMDSGINPRDLKMDLARAIVTLYHGDNEAKKAQEHFKTVFQNKDIPDEIEIVEVNSDTYNIVDLISELEMCPSKSDGRRLVQGGGVKIDSNKVESIDFEVKIGSDGVLVQVGKRKFKRVLYVK